MKRATKKLKKFFDEANEIQFNKCINFIRYSSFYEGQTGRNFDDCDILNTSIEYANSNYNEVAQFLLDKKWLTKYDFMG